ncbi:hypothetical protein PFICI_03055 [Pestalotiopsis fici W106-1]|uniref:NAD(P)-binding domain-containing protein n=1 Tax=Pestalotiopsis fici (strain W106-1 / CGMCC3.15140) TaxID=1229662 RepID=W3XG71_PESFW|nr:uncharacterized protein PFICI_03055 [Pestalotiopsis fici W106-1]ETS85030.1 hypothetical protein PFICI_03055 [Pestalotiopsis fici W106-1]
MPPSTMEEVGEENRNGATTNASFQFSWNDDQALQAMDVLEAIPGIKTICVTGGAGFIGSWVFRSLTLTYPMYHFICYDNFEYSSSLNNLHALDGVSNWSLVRGDVSDEIAVTKCFFKHKIDAVMHFAAQSHVDLSFDAPHAFCKTNLTGTVVLLEAARKFGVKRFIHVSTDEVYGEVSPGQPDHKESDVLCPTNPYSGSKAAAEMMVCAYAKSFGLPTIIVRSNNVYGPNQFPEKIIPKFTILLHRKQKVPLYGSGEYTRRYIYAGDVANAFNFIFHRGEIGETYNIGTVDRVSNIEVIGKILAASQKVAGINHSASLNIEKWIQSTPNRPFMDRHYAVDFTKLTDLGWSQKVALDDGFRRTVSWYERYGEQWWGDISSHLGSGVFKTEPSIQSS